MSLRAIATELQGVIVLEPVVHRDARGFFVETYRQEQFEAIGIDARFVQANHSRSMRHTLRGLHWQWRRPQAKLVRVVRGEIFQVTVDVRRGSPTFGKWVGVELSDVNLRATYVPVGFAHGFCVLSDIADVEYLCTETYDPGGEAGLRWDDPLVGIQWPITSPVLSKRDSLHGPLDVNRPDLLVYSGE